MVPHVFVSLIVCVLIIPIVGCSTAAQREEARMVTVITDSVASARTCLEAIADNPEYSSLKSKTIMDANARSVPLQMRNDKTFPTKQEILLIYNVHGEKQDCRKILLDGASKVHPVVLLTFIEGFAASDKLTAQLTGGQLTWGQYNEGLQDLLTQTQEKLIKASVLVGSQLQRQHQAELAQRQRAAEAAMKAALQQWSYQQQQIALQQQAIQAASRSRTINCRRFGDTLQCTGN